MIQTSRFLSAIKSRVRIWEFEDICRSEEEAHDRAALLRQRKQGVCIKKGNDKSFMILAWSVDRDLYNA